MARLACTGARNALVMAHEFGHAVQARVASGRADHTRLRTPELDQLLRGYFLLRDPVGTSTAARSAHGSPSTASRRSIPATT